MLYVVATPIGNLGDITYRAVETLSGCDYILCEDTRHSSGLLHHYQIRTKLKSYHKFNEASRLSEILSDLQKGLRIALISDAGTPAVSDPGQRLVKAAVKINLPVTVLPGPCAAIAALSISGLDTDQFTFIGFFSKKKGELEESLIQALERPCTTIAYESSQRLPKLLERISAFSPERELAVARELTKIYEEVKRGKAVELKEYFRKHKPKGEVVVLIAGKDSSEGALWEKYTPEAHVRYLEETYHLSKKEAVKLAAQQRNTPKREIYNLTLMNYPSKDTV